MISIFNILTGEEPNTPFKMILLHQCFSYISIWTFTESNFTSCNSNFIFIPSSFTTNGHLIFVISVMEYCRLRSYCLYNITNDNVTYLLWFPSLICSNYFGNNQYCNNLFCCRWVQGLGLLVLLQYSNFYVSITRLFALILQIKCIR